MGGDAKNLSSEFPKKQDSNQSPQLIRMLSNLKQQQKHDTNHFLALFIFFGHFMKQKPLGHAIIKFQRFYRLPGINNFSSVYIKCLFANFRLFGKARVTIQ